MHKTKRKIYQLDTDKICALMTVKRKKAFSKPELAAAIGVHRQTLEKWKKAGKLPNTNYILKIMDLVETDKVHDILKIV